MKKLIKDEIYGRDLIFFSTSVEKQEQFLVNFYKKLGEIHEPAEINIYCKAEYIRLVRGDKTKDYFIWIRDDLLKKFPKNIELITHELNHHVDTVFDEVGMLQIGGVLRDITEARAYYYEYLLRQVLKYLYK